MSRLERQVGDADPGRGDAPVVLPWTLLSPEDTAVIDARGRGSRQCCRQIAGLPPQAWVTVLDDRPLSRWRLRRLARISGLSIERELIVLPAFDGPAAVVQDVRWAIETFRHAAGHIGLVPWTVRAVPETWVGWLAPARVLVGRRP